MKPQFVGNKYPPRLRMCNGSVTWPLELVVPNDMKNLRPGPGSLGEERDGLGASLFVQVRQDQRGTFCRVANGDGTTEARAGTRDHCDLVLEHVRGLVDLESVHQPSTVVEFVPPVL